MDFECDFRMNHTKRFNSNADDELREQLFIDNER